MEITITFSKDGRKRDFDHIPVISTTRRATSDDTFCSKNYLEKKTLEIALKSRAQTVCGCMQCIFPFFFYSCTVHLDVIKVFYLPTDAQ